MLAWIAASLLFFAYVTGTAPLVRGLRARRRWLAAAGAAVGFALALAGNARPPTPLIHDWILPPALLLIGYWSSGLLFAAPMPRAEQMLERFDRLLAVDSVAAATPRWLAELLELSYLAVYPLIPIAFLIHMFGTEAPHPERFWTVILITDFICFGFLPWIQTRPPRALRSADPWVSRLRWLNLRMLGKTSIQVNTFPSGHAAEAFAIVLLVAGAPWPVVAAVGISGLLVSVGAVLGRYHFAADAIAGWVVAVVVWMLV